MNGEQQKALRAVLAALADLSIQHRLAILRATSLLLMQKQYENETASKTTLSLG